MRPVVSMGNFDGVHLGHQRMIQELVKEARARDCPSVVIVFEPQPQEFFSDNPPARLTTYDEKYALMKTLGVDEVYCLGFDEALAELSAEEFIENILVEDLQIQHIIVGDDFRFGHQRQGDLALLKDLGKKHGFTTESLGSIIVGSERVSSTRVREALKAGQFDEAALCLGRPYSMRGAVQEGDQRGRLLGYPTANIDPARIKVPLTGVYSVKVHGLGETTYMGMANLGTRPTIGGLQTLLEVNIFDFNQDIYGETLEIEFCQKIRDEQRFESLEALKAQIQADHKAVESYFHHG